MRPIRVVSTFAGMGQLDRGFELAGGFEIVARYEFWPKAVEVNNANAGEANCHLANIKELGPLDVPDFDLLIGGPPCQPFSQARKHMHGGAQKREEARQKMGVNDPRDCIPDFFRIANGRHFLMENVEQGLPELHGIADYHARRLVASKFGDVTHRRRWFYSDLFWEPVETPGPRRFRAADPEHDVRDVSVDDDPSAYRRNIYAQMRQWAKHPSHDGFFGTLTTLSHDLWNNVAQRNLIAIRDQHPAPRWPIDELVRCPTTLEMARAHSIPDDWDWCGATQAEVAKMIGNGVPIGMATAVAVAIRKALRGK